MNDEFRKALRSLPWYLVGGWLFLPAVLALFTAGWSLIIYLAPGMLFGDKPNDLMTGVLMLLGPGLLIWIPRQFIRAAIYSWKKNHLVHLPS